MKWKFMILLATLLIPFVVNAEELKLEWIKSSNAIINSVKETSHNEFVAVGYINESEGYYNGLLVKYDSEGKELWSQSWGGNYSDYFEEVHINEKDEIIVIGDFNSTNIEGLSKSDRSDIIIVKYDKDGNLLWQRNWGGSSDESYRLSMLTQDEDIVIVTEAQSKDVENMTINGFSDYAIIKYDKDGNLLWQRNWGGSDSDFCIL